MSVTLVLTDVLADELQRVAGAEVETAGVVLASLIETPDGDVRVLAREIHWVPDSAYTTREADGLVITSEGYVPSLRRAETTGAVPIWLHTHPGEGAQPGPSRNDDEVDRQLADLFRLRSGSPFYGTVIISTSRGGLAFTGRLESDESCLEIDRLWIAGRWFALVPNWLHRSEEPSELFDRSVRAFGGGIQRALGDLSIAIVGCGGTGSAVAEQLVRLGVRRFLLLDPDELSLSNVTRVYGSIPADVGRTKVDVVGDHILRIAPDAWISKQQASITDRLAAVKLLDADIVFGCTDDNAGRLVLSRLATYALTPVIDCGVLISSDEFGIINGIDGRVTVLAPGAACLVCRDRIDLRRAAAEVMTPDEHGRLVGEGYAPALGGVDPAVIAYTTLVAAAAVGELLERLIHFGPTPVPSELILRIHDRELSTNDQGPRPRHYCHPDQGKLGIGVTEPFLEQTWPR